MPAKFKDRLGREWELCLTVADLKTLREVGFDLSKATGSADGLVELLFGDPERLVAACCILAHTPDSVSGDDFAAGFDGPTLEAAGLAVVEAVVDFFPRSAVAKWMKERLTQGMAEFDAELIRKLSSVSAGSLPGTPASTPAP